MTRAILQSEDRKMSYRKYREMIRQWRRLDRLFPDRGFGHRPWKEQLHRAIGEEIEEGLRGGYAWAKRAALQWDLYGDWKSEE